MISVLLDENMPFNLIELFEKVGHITYHVKKLGKTGIKNGEVYKLSLELKAWIITRDSDFENLAKFEQYDPYGVVVIKTNITTSVFLRKLFKTLLEKKSIDFSQQQLIVIDEDGIKILKQ